MPASLPFSLEHDAHGKLVLRRADGTVRTGVHPVRAFPLSDPDGALSIVGTDGRELAWIERRDALDAATLALVDAELARREFTPVIERLIAVSTFSTPSEWTVQTDRGRTSFVLKGEEDIRRLGDGALLVTDSHGVGWRVVDQHALDRRSRRLLERFL